MEGPTPVSSLLHAATMVTAGVFLLIRSSGIFEYSNNVLFFVALIGALTAFFSGVIGVFQYDVKKNYCLFNLFSVRLYVFIMWFI